MDLNEEDVLTLILAVLDREPDAHRILADLLEEAGQPGAAQHARAKKSKTQKRIDFALTAMPARLAIGIACEFLQSEWKLRYKRYRDVVKLLDELRAWTAGDPDVDFESARDRLSRLRTDGRNRFSFVEQSRLDRIMYDAGDYYSFSVPAFAQELKEAIAELLKREEKLGRQVWFADAAAVKARQIVGLCRLNRAPYDKPDEKLQRIRERIEERLAILSE